MVVTNDEEKFNKLKTLDHGRVPGTFWIDELGISLKCLTYKQLLAWVN